MVKNIYMIQTPTTGTQQFNHFFETLPQIISYDDSHVLIVY